MYTHSTPVRTRSLWLCLVAALQLTACGGGGGSEGGGAVANATVDTATVAGAGAGAGANAGDRAGILAASSSRRPTQRTLTLGTVAGIDNAHSSGTYAWLGIPYAKPPVGALRWRPPVDPEPWTGVRTAQQFGASCAQGGRYFSPAPNDAPYGLSVREGFGKPVGREDCLTLNVWRPATTDTALPVIVFIHGGSNISGYSADPVYDGQVLAKKANAVVVTINYRLGLFGWFDLPQLKTGDPVADSGNFGNLDQVQALKFVQANAAAFGGDAANVTVMGESAGAVNIWALMVSPLTQGLFHKAVPLSGGLAFTNGVQSKAYATGLLASTLVADGKAGSTLGTQLYLATRSATQVASYLRGKSADELIAIELASGLGTAPAVITDGAVVAAEPHLAIATGAYRNVPVLAGNTAEEAKLFGGLIGAYKLNDYDRFGLQYGYDPDAPSTLTEADLLNSAYLPVDKPVLGWNTVTFALTTAVFTRGTIESMATLALKQPQQLWYYNFAWKQQRAPFDTVYGAAHAMDLPFVFGNFGRNAFSFAYGEANRPGREALSEAMIGSVAAFARTGNPNHEGLPVAWPNWPRSLVFDASKTALDIRVP